MRYNILLFAFQSFSKISLDFLQKQVAKLFDNSEGENKERKFEETIELQIALKDYDPKKDARFKGSIVLDYAPYPNIPIAVLGNVNHCDEAKALNIDCLNQDEMKPMKKQNKMIKKWARKYKAIFCSEKLMKTMVKIMGRQLVKMGKMPLPIREGEKIDEKHETLKHTVKFQLKKVVDLGTAIGRTSMTQQQVVQNITKAVNFLISLLKKGWQNVKTIHIKRTMSKSYRIYSFK